MQKFVIPNVCALAIAKLILCGVSLTGGNEGEILAQNSGKGKK